MERKSKKELKHLEHLYRARFELYERFRRRELDRQGYFKLITPLDKAIDRLEMSLLAACPISRTEP